MQLKLQITGSRAIVYDANRIPQPEAKLFDPGYWAQVGAVVGEAQGRGNALMLETPFGPAALRQYLRGGLAAKVSRDRYLFLGYSRARPLAEAEILTSLAAQGLPVPQVLAATCLRHGLSYSGALLTQRIVDATPLADLLPGRNGRDPMWFAIGRCLHRFHAAGVYHADLNVRNILIDIRNTVWLIDFDRARIISPHSRRLQQNLQRLLRSLGKLCSLPAAELKASWNSLISGYQNEV